MQITKPTIPIPLPQEITVAPTKGAYFKVIGSDIYASELILDREVTEGDIEAHFEEVDFAPVVDVYLEQQLASYELIDQDNLPIAVQEAEWEAGQWVFAGNVRSFGDTDYEAIQNHKTQYGWEPPSVPALWKAIPATVIDPETGTELPPAWVQPQGAHDAYAKDSTVTLGGKTWQSLVDGNVWQPPTQWKEVSK